MAPLALHENLPDRSYKAGLYPVEEGLHVREHEYQEKEERIHQKLADEFSAGQLGLSERHGIFGYMVGDVQSIFSGDHRLPLEQWHVLYAQYSRRRSHQRLRL
ncbi:hypothetical protein GMOD_00008601 [Pyrenophora seminiperda CCB06]|uniref:Uncharacterized protein n=1 Tax=Pyrenophora seminiperda CCB06 TaxID=1302712 RepID=A0A3M7M8X4_9PLEO|nr:hypothetical protein GMOD_00008601 [Pyrenophora seminiperda CCB06]